VILVLRALGIGDLATAVPALRGLRRAFPDRVLALAAPAWLTPLVELIGGVDRLVPVAGLAPVGWRVPPPYRAVNLHGRGPESHRLLLASAPKRLWAFRCPAAGHLDGPQWMDTEHEVDRWCRLLQWYGVPSDPSDLALQPPTVEVPAGVTVLHPGGKSPERRWPAERFGVLARELVALGHRPVVTGTPAERPLAERVAAVGGLPPEAVLAGRTGLAELAALVARARLVVTGDTGVGHLATAFGTPSVVLFGPTSPAQWGPPSDRAWHRALWPGVTSAAATSSDEAHPVLAAIGVADVLAAAVEVEQTALRQPDARLAVPDASAAQ